MNNQHLSNNVIGLPKGSSKSTTDVNFEAVDSLGVSYHTEKLASDPDQIAGDASPPTLPPNAPKMVQLKVGYPRQLDTDL